MSLPPDAHAAVAVPPMVLAVTSVTDSFHFHLQGSYRLLTRLKCLIVIGGWFASYNGRVSGALITDRPSLAARSL
jgi:hypothetical protein